MENKKIKSRTQKARIKPIKYGLMITRITFKVNLKEL